LQPVGNQVRHFEGLHYAGSFGRELLNGDFRRRLFQQLQLQLL